jgi:RNA-directed DNA polymerase
VSGADWNVKSGPTTEKVVVELTIREATLPPNLRALRQKLGQKAKQEKRWRFYSLYGHLLNPEILRAAWMAVKRNDGAAGVDGVSIGRIAAKPETEEAFLAELVQSLKERTYRAQAVRRVYIPKANGKLRPLGIPTVRDRVVQAAVLLLLEPIFEADFEDCSFGFRPGRSAHDALKAIREHLNTGHVGVYDADLAGYFDSIPHDKLMACVRMRVVDGAILGLIRQWLRAPVVEPSSKGGPPTVKRNDKGTPQGGVLSPLLANVYLHWFDRAFHRLEGPAQWAKAKLVRYADDFVVLARYVGTEMRTWIEAKLEGWLGLHINRDKTRVVDLRRPGTSLDFLGYTLRWDRDLYEPVKHYWYLGASRKAVLREKDVLRRKTGPKRCAVPLPDLIKELNRHLKSWAGYFRLGQPRRTFRLLNGFLRERLTHHLRRRSQRNWRPRRGTNAFAHLDHMGLVRL